jgi:hypothetical protein
MEPIYISTGYNGSSGTVIRDHLANIVVAESRTYQWLPDALTVEARAARDGLALAQVAATTRAS